MRATGFGEFRGLAARGNIIPVWREIPGDCLTPVLAWLCTARRARQSFLLESVEGGERIARYSFVGSEPWRVLSARGNLMEETEGRRVRTFQGRFLDRLRETFARFHPVSVPGLPRFTGGAVGYISYDAAALLDPASARGGTREAPMRHSDPDVPHAWFALCDTLLAFDHLRQSLLLLTSVMTERDGRGLRAQFDGAVAKLDRLQGKMARRARATHELRPVPLRRPRRHASPAASEESRREFIRMVSRARRHIRAGDIFQVVLSQRFRRRLSCDPFEVYRNLRRINPSPYMYFIRDGDLALAGASPEMMVRVEGSDVELHPIAGTRGRGTTPEQDTALEKGLLSDPKERAEHVMLVDLGRNDLGRICRPASVKVPEFMKVERFSHVMHLVSRVTGRLAAGRDAFHAMEAVFPAGTVSGAPKVRAMQIIGSLEKSRRGAYAGAVCYIDHSGNLDSCITIRTMVSRGREAWVQAGAGIVADSRPALEHRECLDKARAVLAAIDGAM